MWICVGVFIRVRMLASLDISSLREGQRFEWVVFRKKQISGNFEGFIRVLWALLIEMGRVEFKVATECRRRVEICSLNAPNHPKKLTASSVRPHSILVSDSRSTQEKIERQICHC